MSQIYIYSNKPEQLLFRGIFCQFNFFRRKKKLGHAHEVTQDKPNTTTCKTQKWTFTYLIYKILVSSEPRYMALKANCKMKGAWISIRIKIILKIGISFRFTKFRSHLA